MHSETYSKFTGGYPIHLPQVNLILQIDPIISVNMFFCFYLASPQLDHWDIFLLLTQL